MCNGSTAPRPSPRLASCRSLSLHLDLVQVLDVQGVNVGHVRPRSPPSRPSASPRLRAAVTCRGRCVTGDGGRVGAGTPSPSPFPAPAPGLSDRRYLQETGGCLSPAGSLSPPLCQRRRSRCRHLGHVSSGRSRVCASRFRLTAGLRVGLPWGVFADFMLTLCKMASSKGARRTPEEPSARRTPGPRGDTRDAPTPAPATRIR